ncbi:hypothetical protein GC173_19025 [bacterium]|nr:hypothetical protein [bacterium]
MIPTLTLETPAMSFLISLKRTFAAACAIAGLATASQLPAQVVISQVYASGGDAGAAYQRDFIELFNQSYDDVTLTAWAIQYSSPTATSGNYTRNNIAANTVIPGRSYLLLTRTTAGANGVALTGDQAILTANYLIAGGKVALTNNQTTLVNSGTGAPTVTTAIVDYLGWGTANYREGTTSASALTVANSHQRAGAGCTDTNQSNSDFTAAAVSPRSLATAKNYNCSNDLLAPTVSAASLSNSFLTGPLTQFSVTFDQPMVTVPAGNLTVNGSAATAVSGSNLGPYIFSGFTTPATGAVTITLAASGLADNQAQTLAADYTVTGNTVAELPTPVITSGSVTDGGVAGGTGAIAFTMTFNEDVTGFAIGDISAVNATLSSFVAVNATTYTFNATPGHGPVSLTVGAGAASATAAPNNLSAAADFDWTHDRIGPRKSSSSAIPTAVNAPIGAVSVTFNEPIYNLALADISLSRDFSPVSLSGLGITWNPGDTTVSFDLSSYNTTDGVYGLIVGQTGAGSTATDQYGNKVNQPGVFSWILDRTAPTATLTGPVDSTLIGTTDTLTFSTTILNGAGLGNTPQDTVALEVIAPGLTSYGPSGAVASGSTFPVTFATGGRYTYRVAVSDTAGNVGYSSPVTIEVNPTVNGALTQTVTAATETLVFPMTNGLNVTIALTGATPGGTLTVQRLVGPISSPGAGIGDPSKLISEYLDITSSGLGSFTATLTWDYDAANVGSITVNRAFRVSGGSVAGSYTVTPSGNTVTINGITGFSEWYLGDASANVSDWTTLAD